MSKYLSEVSQTNIDVYCLLYCIEVGVRELIIEEMTRHFRGRWWKQRLPSDVKQKYQNARDTEQRTPWTQLVPHHPLYYVDFPDLQKIIARQDNWKDVFEDVFGRRDIVSSTLRELEPIRNKIAHNRKATPKDLEVVKGSMAKVAQAVGQSRFAELVRKCTIAEDIPALLDKIAREAEAAFESCQAYKELPPRRTWDKVESEWWFDEEYLGSPVARLRDLFEMFATYEQLSRSRGSGHKIEAWVKTSGIDQVYRAGMGQLSRLRQERGGG